MPGLLDLENYFPPEKVEAVYAALIETLREALMGPRGWSEHRPIVGAFAAELRRRGFVVTAFRPAVDPDIRAATDAFVQAARAVNDLWDEPDPGTEAAAEDSIWMTIDESAMAAALRSLRSSLAKVDEIGDLLRAGRAEAES